jgi:hypothetical protein
MYLKVHTSCFWIVTKLIRFMMPCPMTRSGCFSKYSLIFAWLTIRLTEGSRSRSLMLPELSIYLPFSDRSLRIFIRSLMESSCFLMPSFTIVSQLSSIFTASFISFSLCFCVCSVVYSSCISCSLFRSSFCYGAIRYSL